MKKKIYVKPEIECELLMQMSHLLDAVSSDQGQVTGVQSEDLTWKDGGFEDEDGDN